LSFHSPVRAALLRERAELLARVARIDLELAALEEREHGEVEEYSSVSLPLGATRRAFRERCAAGLVAGAHREGKTWRCSTEAWRASFARKAKLAIVPPTSEPDLEQLADVIVARSARPTRRAG
jgi:hypothetical protein